MLGGRKQRSVLAILLVHANEVVSADRLMEELWSGRPPPSAAMSLQAHVSRLRRALGDDQRIVTTAGGYLIRVAEGELDRDRFERLVEEGSAAILTEDWESASGKLREALGLWRGAAAGRLSVRLVRAGGDRPPVRAAGRRGRAAGRG